jgi:hypothetical protein
MYVSHPRLSIAHLLTKEKTGANKLLPTMAAKLLG